MLPALKTDRLSLADVFPSCLAAIAGTANPLGLSPARAAVVLLVDGLGASSLAARAGHARTLAAAMSKSSTISSGFPTTTAAAITTLTTGARPGQHGIVGFSALDAANDRVVNQLSGWDDRIDPATWQSLPTIFEQARDAGFRASAVGSARYNDSGFSRAVLRGATYVSAASISDRLATAARLVDTPGPNQLIYVYVPELDKAAHATGSQSNQWTSGLEKVDAAVRDFVATVGNRAGLLVTADHGVVDVPAHSHVVFDEVPELMAGVRFVAGEPRCLQLHFDPASTAQQRSATVQSWRESEGERSWVLTRNEAVQAGWFGEVSQEVLPRIGDIIVAARKEIAYYESTASPRSRAMVGQHGSWSPAEVIVPLLRFGAFAA